MLRFHRKLPNTIAVRKLLTLQIYCKFTENILYKIHFDWLIDWSSQVLRPSRHKIGHFWDAHRSHFLASISCSECTKRVYPWGFKIRVGFFNNVFYFWFERALQKTAPVLKRLVAIQRWSAICRVWPWTLSYQKFLLCISSQGQELFSHQKLNM